MKETQARTAIEIIEHKPNEIVTCLACNGQNYDSTLGLGHRADRVFAISVTSTFGCGCTVNLCDKCIRILKRQLEDL